MQKEPLFFLYLLGTILIEGLALFALVRLYYKHDATKIPTNTLLFAACVSVGTLPYVWFIFPVLVKDYISYLLVAEAFAVCAETLFYCFVLRLDLRKCLLISVICNALSFGAGQLINEIFF